MTLLNISKTLVRRLTRAQRDLLIQHIDVPVDVVLTCPNLVGCRNALMRLALLRGEPANTIRPRQTVLTEHGRQALAMILGEYADALVRAGLLEENETPLEILQRLKTTKQSKPPAISADLALAPVVAIATRRSSS